MGSLMKMYTPLNGIERHRKCLAITKSHFPKITATLLTVQRKAKVKSAGWLIKKHETYAKFEWPFA